VAPWANWAVGLYGDAPVRLRRVYDSANTFWTELARPDALVLHETHRGRPFLAGTPLRQELRAFLRGAPDTVHWVSASTFPRVEAAASAEFRANGYCLVRTVADLDTRFRSWTRTGCGP
ncbi:MAG: hypothetical protein ACK4N5_25030, partial [Myxococcales bacterium]